jgi:hypothetical protein
MKLILKVSLFQILFTSQSLLSVKQSALILFVDFVSDALTLVVWT